LLGAKQHAAISALQQLKKRIPEIAPVAIQFEVESSIDTEILTREFNMVDFIRDSTAWAESVMNAVNSRSRK
jgi:hypothetical protein